LYIGLDEKPRSIVVTIPHQGMITGIEITSMQISSIRTIAAMCLL
jgi:hypothetical protein